MKITCDPAKRAATLIDRDVDFLDAEQVFAGRTLTVQDTRRAYGDARHVISMRKCNAKEQKRYSQRFAEA